MPAKAFFEEGAKVDYVSKNEIVDSFNGSMRLTVNANGEEYRLFGSILDLVQKSIVDKGVYPPFFGSCRFDERFSGAMPYLAREHKEIKGFPDLIYINEEYVLCVDHVQINASEPRSNYENGDEYRAFLARHKELLEKEQYDELEKCLDKEGIQFRRECLEGSLLHALNSKMRKVPKYKGAAYDYIASGDNLVARDEDLAKTMEVWLLIEDVTPTTSFEAAFSNDQVLSALEGCEELEGLIYVHHPYLTRAPQSISDFVLIHNDSTARNQLRLMHIPE